MWNLYMSCNLADYVTHVSSNSGSKLDSTEQFKAKFSIPMLADLEFFSFQLAYLIGQ